MGITLQKVAGAILFALILIFGLNIGGAMLFPEQPPPSQAAAPKAETKAAPQQAQAPTNQGPPSAEKGQAVAKKCQSCHNFNQGGGTKVGPELYGVVGRPKASMPGFAYSDGLKALGGTWTNADLDKFLTKPSAYAAGTKMSFPGLPDAADRGNVIAYLRSISPKAPPP